MYTTSKRDGYVITFLKQQGKVNARLAMERTIRACVGTLKRMGKRNKTS
jgi:hypothetical protein